MNFLEDGGFELGLSVPNGWAYSNRGAGRFDCVADGTYGPAHSGRYVGEIFAFRDLVQPIPPIWGAPVNGYVVWNSGYPMTLPDGLYYLSAWFKQLAPPAALNLEVQYLDNTGADATALVARSPGNPAFETAPAWSYLGGLYVHDSSGARSDWFQFKLRAEWSGDDPRLIGGYFVDDCRLEGVMPNNEPYHAFAALFNRIGTINGNAGGYYYDLTGKVIPFLRYPGTAGAPVVPYACVCLEDNGEITEYDRGMITDDVRIAVYGFFPTSESGAVSSCTAANALHFAADLNRCILPDSSGSPCIWNLGSAVVENVRFVSKRRMAEPIEEVPPHVMVTVDARVRYVREELGPGAV